MSDQKNLCQDVPDLGNVCQGVPGAENGNSESFSAPPSETNSKNAMIKYDFVLNNYTEEEVCQIKHTIKEICSKGGFGFEVGESGTPHLQGAIWLHKKERITGLHKKPGFARASFRPIRNEEALIKYIQKDGNTWLHGFPKPLKLITPSKPWQINILQILQTEADDRTVHWYWSEKGGVGKSQFAKYLVAKENALFFEEGRKADIMHLIHEAPEDRLEKIIIDVPRANGNKISYKSIESIKNGMIYSSKYEGGYRLFNAPHVIIFANAEPKYEELSEDRWIVTNIDENNST